MSGSGILDSLCILSRKVMIMNENPDGLVPDDRRRARVPDVRSSTAMLCHNRGL